MKQKINIVWFRNDLRVRNNEALYKACQDKLPVVGVYFFDPAHYATTNYGFKKTEKFRARFILESIQELKENLAAINIPLHVKLVSPDQGFLEISKNFDIRGIFLQKEWTSEEVATEQEIQKTIPPTGWHRFYQQFLFHPDDFPYPDVQFLPEVFTEFRKKCEKFSRVRTSIPIPTKRPDENLSHIQYNLPSLSDLGLEEFDKDPRSAFPFKGGENQAWKRIEDYFWETKKLQYYKKTRNGLVGTDYSSKLSPWLANGCISTVDIYWEVKRFEKEIKKNQDTYWLIFELIWRDYFKYVSQKHGNKIFFQGGILNKDYEWKNNEKAFQQWINGNTNEDFVNANMIELKETGFMSNRGRQNVNSFWAKEWHQDWRKGAAYFESMLIDYDVHSNWGNWMYNSGVGNDPRDRKFNIKGQAERYDANGKYQRLWLQESLF